MLTLRPMSDADLSTVSNWLLLAHVARWWTSTTTPSEVIELYRLRVKGQDRRTHMLMVSESEEDIGWCQWYLWVDYPEESLTLGANEGEIGFDYAIGDPAFLGRGLGTKLVAALVEHARHIYPGVGILVEPEESNTPSRRALEKNGFVLTEVRPEGIEEGAYCKALYRLPSTLGVD